MFQLLDFGKRHRQLVDGVRLMVHVEVAQLIRRGLCGTPRLRDGIIDLEQRELNWIKHVYWLPCECRCRILHT